MVDSTVFIVHHEPGTVTIVTTQRTITVLGATGRTGRRLTDTLLDRGWKVRRIARTARPHPHPAATTHTGDLTDTDFLTTAFTGVDAAYVLVPFDPTAADVRAHMNDIGSSITDALRRARVPRVVALSSLGAELEHGTGFLTALHAQEQRLTALETDLVLLRPGYFFDNLEPVLPHLRHIGALQDSIAPDVPLPMVAAGDVGAAAAAAVEEPEHQGTTVREIRTAVDLTLTDLAAAVGRAQGIGHLPYQQLPDEETMTQLLQVGFSDDAARLQVEMHHAFSAGRVAAAGDDPRAPTTVDDYLASRA